MVKKEAKPETPNVESKSSGTESSESFNINAFVLGTRDELGKVVWPSRQQLISESVAVILMVALSASIIYFVDKLFSWASKQVF